MRPDPRPSAAREVYLNSRDVMNRYGASPMWVWRRLRDGSGFPQPIVVHDREHPRLSHIIQLEWSNNGGALNSDVRPIQTGVALRFPQHSKNKKPEPCSLRDDGSGCFKAFRCFFAVSR
jgi:hypothetical protein